MANEKTLFEKWEAGEIANFGSFQTSILQAYRIADEGNRNKLAFIFPYWFKNQPPKTAEYNGQTVETIDCTPTWQWCTQIHLAAIEQGNPQGIASGRAGIIDMAKTLDSIVELTKK